jgi:Tfp pilus assembly protein PilW
MLIGSAVFVVVLLAVLMILEVSQRDYASGAAKSDAQQNVRVVLESMARELRMAGYAPSSTPNSDCAAPPCGVTALASSSVTFQADVDGNPPDVCAVPPCMDKVVYAFVPPVDATRPCDALDPDSVGRITRSIQSWVGGAWSPISLTAYDVAQCVKTVTITYYNNTGGAAATPADVRRMTISITGEENVRGHAPSTYRASTDVRLRNL